MKFQYLEENTKHPLINHFYEFIVHKEDLPFESFIVPVSYIVISNTKCEENNIVTHQKNKIEYNNLCVAGQFYGGYTVAINKENHNLGFALHPTTLYKLSKKNIHQFSNQHISIKNVCEDLYNNLKPIFDNYDANHSVFIQKVKDFFDNVTLVNDKYTRQIDKAIAIIFDKKGLISVSDLLKEVAFSQKTLEVWFKKIVGLTPGKYIRQHRFSELIRQYNSNEIEITDLIHQYNYYDSAHFAKDFSLFTGQTMKSFFKKEYPLLKKYLIE